MPEPFVLLVEDCKSVIEMSVKYLEGQSIAYKLAESVTQAKELLLAEAMPAIIIMDGCVKDGETVELVQYIRNVLHYEGMIIATTNDRDDSLVEDMLEAGCDEHWNKYSAVCRAVEAVIEILSNC
jgi:CheY-like chemotaxis protein